MDKKVSITVGPGLGGLLTVLFVALKLTNHIDWSWLWVLSPLWIPWAIIFSIFLGALLVSFIAALLK
jgi:hypothetical protein